MTDDPRSRALFPHRPPNQTCEYTSVESQLAGEVTVITPWYRAVQRWKKAFLTVEEVSADLHKLMREQAKKS